MHHDSTVRLLIETVFVFLKADLRAKDTPITSLQTVSVPLSLKSLLLAPT